MDEWERMFRAVQAITRTSKSVSESLEQTILFASKNTEQFNEPGYWHRVDQHPFTRPVNSVINWAKEGLESLNDGETWELLMLDLGDCPEIFSLYSPGSQALLAEESVRKLLLRAGTMDAHDLAECFASTVDDPFDKLYRIGRTEWVYHNVSELNDTLLSWNLDHPVEYYGDNGYLLWLAIGSAALLEPLRDADYGKRILRGRKRLYLVSGFESIFSYLATVTPEGLLFEVGTSIPVEEFSPASQPTLPFDDVEV